ncbi:MAG: DUF3054 domain-containing protein [Actinomycetota bacterium]
MSDSARRLILIVGDIVALVVFTIIGLMSHKNGVTLSALFKVVLPIIAVAALAAPIFGTYRRPGVRTLLPCWLVSVPGGILIRKVLFHTPADWGSTGVFTVVALAFTLLFLIAWRIIARLVLPLRVNEPESIEYGRS